MIAHAGAGPPAARVFSFFFFFCCMHAHLTDFYAHTQIDDAARGFCLSFFQGAHSSLDGLDQMKLFGVDRVGLLRCRFVKMRGIRIKSIRAL